MEEGVGGMIENACAMIVGRFERSSKTTSDVVVICGRFMASECDAVDALLDSARVVCYVYAPRKRGC